MSTSIFRPSNDQELTRILQNLADPVKTSSQTSFKREFGLLKSQCPESGLWAHHKDMMAVVQRCCTEKKFWPASELEYLIRMQCILPRNYPMVFETLSERKEAGMMFHALKSQQGIPEKCLGIALQFFLSAEEEVLQKAMEGCQPANSHSHSDTCPLTRARRVFVDQILRALYDKVYLISSLKKLPFGLLLDLLKYILHRKQTSPDHRYVDQLSQWEGCIYDAHSTQLVLSKEAHEVLVESSREEDLTEKYYSTVADILPLMMRKRPKKKSPAKGMYRIEILHL
ncbi:hypothetical protein ACOMHN_020881 [Nucella lapillus]